LRSHVRDRGAAGEHRKRWRPLAGIASIMFGVEIYLRNAAISAPI
jgi:hypothetical protein